MHLFSGPEFFGFQDGGWQSEHWSVSIGDGCIDEFLVVVARKESTSHGQGHSANHVILNEACQRCTVLRNEIVEVGGS